MPLQGRLTNIRVKTAPKSPNLFWNIKTKEMKERVTFILGWLLPILKCKYRTNDKIDFPIQSKWTSVNVHNE